MYVLLLFFATVSSQKVRPDIASHPNWPLLDRGEDCGLSSSNRIIGGYNAALGQYPWIAQLGYAVQDYQNSDNIQVEFYNCGGTIINDRYILTAAHCSPVVMAKNDPIELELVQVRLGENDINLNPDCRDGVCAPPVQDLRVEQYYCHAMYDGAMDNDDICLIRVASLIQFDRFVYPICLPVYEKLATVKFESTVLEVAGWGVEDMKSGNRSSILQALKVPFVQLYLCRLAYLGRRALTEKQICAGGVLGQDSCGGDSGGPLMAALSVDGPPRYFLLGVVSYGPQHCGKSLQPAVYTKVSAYMAWILDNIRK